jgi:hypothetical protein
MNPERFWFKSSRFEIEPGEDVDINPRIYGRRLAIWLKERLEQSAYAVEEIIKAGAGASCAAVIRSCLGWDAATCRIFARRNPGDAPPSKETATWHCFATADVPFLKRIFGRMDTGPGAIGR